MEKAKVRESNIELLRNISMFMILVIHANFVSLPRIGIEELSNNTIPSVTRFFIESLGIVAVNVFVFISGWFGIRTRLKSVLSFIYQILFFLLGGGILLLLFGKGTLSVNWLLDVFQLSARDWFIKSYLLLMIIAPALNAYTQHTEERTQRYVMIAFFLFEAIFGWAMGGRRFFVDGYGPLHFIGLYLTAQYIHNEIGRDECPTWLKTLFKLSNFVDLSIYLLTVILNTVLILLASKYVGDVAPVHALVYAYSNPLVIIGALYLLLFFSKVRMPYVKIINWLGASSFAVYLFHGEINVRNDFFTPQVLYLFETYSGLGCVGMVFIFLIFVYLLSVALDQIRIWTWNVIWKTLDVQK